MSLTERDLRDLLAEHAADVTAGPGRAAVVLTQARRERRRRSTAVAIGFLAVATMVWPIARQVGGRTQSPAVTPSTNQTPSSHYQTPDHPMVTSHVGTADGLRITTTGPLVIKGAGRAPFTVTVTLTNTSSATWRGSVGVGLCGIVVGYFGAPAKDPLLYPAGFPVTSPTDPVWFHFGTPSNRVEGYEDPTPRSISAGETITVTIGMVDENYGYPHTAIRGWLPVLNPREPSVRAHPDCSTYSQLGFE